MTLPKFIHIPPQGIIKGVGIIMSTSEPFLYANILQLRTNEDVAASMVQYQPYAVKQVSGYNILVIFGGTMLKSNLTNEEISKTLEAITYFFKTEKIAPNAGYYKKYLTA